MLLIVWGTIIPVLPVIARNVLLSAVPDDKRGQASGVNVSLQMLGGTVGVAICSVLLTMTGSYWPVFVVIGVCVLLMAPVSWETIGRH